jgi:fermentation-respiration switch protein FrsA (DUF1100 family)
MGGAVAIMAARECPQIAAVVADSVYPTLEQAVERRARMLFGPLAPIVQPTTHGLWRWLHGADPAAVSPVEAIGALSPRPVLLIRCSWDIFLSETDALALYEAAGEPREFWRVDATHVRGHAWRTGDYMTRVLDFLRRHGL